jgi:hypothetical protein
VELADISKYLVYGGVILTALLLGRWYATERDRLMARGEPWVNSLVTKPGIIIILILGAMIFYKIKYG